MQIQNSINPSTTTRNSAAMLSIILAFSLPMLLGLYWPLVGLHIPGVAGIVRGGIFAITGLFAMLWWKAPATNTERQWSGLFGAYLGLLFLNAFAAEQIARSLQNGLRILFIVVFCLLVARAFRHTPTRRAFGFGALVAALSLSVYIVGCYVHFLGFMMPTYVATRIFKATVAHALGVGLNPLGFATSFSCMVAVCTLRPSWLMNIMLASVIFVCSVFTGSRTPLALLFVSLAIVVLVELSRSSNKFRLFTLYILLPAILLASVYSMKDGVNTTALSTITENRTDLWGIAWAKFTERPLTGYGADSWGDDMVQRSPGLYNLTAGLVEHHAGSYHNAYMALLAEEGIFVFGFVLFLIVTIFRTIAGTPGTTRQERQRRALLLFAATFVVLRGLIEVPGWFGYGEDPAEFSCYALLALIISNAPALVTRTRVFATPQGHIGTSIVTIPAPVGSSFA